MNDLEKLKNLLFGAEKEALESISARVEQPTTRTLDVSDVLPQAIRKSHQQGTELVESLAEPVGECLQQAISEHPETYSDALYPVMGPAIRKSITHALRAFSEQISQAVEHSLTPKGLKWRFQASRAGIPFGDFVIQQTLLYRVEQVYLISRENGLLVEHVHHAASKIKDSDAVSAMFTAIQDFVKESFSPDRSGRLETADMGEFTLWAVHGPHALLVCVIRGVPPKSLRGELSAILENIHFRYGDAIRNYSGDTATIPDVDTELEKCLTFQAVHEKQGRKHGPPWAIIILALCAIGLLSYFLIARWSESRQIDKLSAALNQTPGIHIADIERDGDQLIVRGLRDPLAANVSDIANQLDIGNDRITSQLSPFQSIEPIIVRQRVARLLDSADSIDYALAGSHLTVTGSATSTWITETRIAALTLAGVDSVDFAAVVDSEQSSIATQVAALSGARFLFEKGTASLAPGQESALRALAEKLSALQSLANKSDQRLEIKLTGSTDASGTVQLNAELRRLREQSTATILAEFGLDATAMNVLRTQLAPDADGTGAELRSVEVEVLLANRSGAQ